MSVMTALRQRMSFLLAPNALSRSKAKRVAGHLQSPVLKKYLVEGFHQIEGWCGGPDTFLLLDILAGLQPSACADCGAAEIGVHHGLFFIAMHNRCSRDAKSLAIDLFEFQHLNVDHSGHGERSIFLSNLAKHAISPDNCFLHRGDSLSLGEADINSMREKYGPFRFFSVDGGHTADHCFKDLCTSEELTAAGGVVILDDSFAYDWPGVTEGLFRYLNRPEAKLAPFAATSKKVFLTQNGHCRTYAAGLKEELSRRDVKFHTKNRTISGSPVLILFFAT
jgi:cephalosporin hydroxylase